MNSVIVQFQNNNSLEFLVLPTDVTKNRFSELLVKSLLVKNIKVDKKNLVYPFYIDDQEIMSDLNIGRTIRMSSNNSLKTNSGE